MEGRHKELYHYNLESNRLREFGYEQGLKEVYDFVQPKLNSENLHFFLGSGCSYPAISLMGQTFDEVKSKLRSIESDVLGVFDDKDNTDSRNIEAYLNWLKSGLEFLGQEKGEDYQKAFDLVREKLIKSITKQRGYNNPGDEVREVTNFYQEFYRTIFSKRKQKDLAPVNVFTSNYDLFNEISLDKNGIHYTNGFRGIIQRVFDPSVYRLRLVDDEDRYKDKWSTIRDYVKLYKVHGSIDWMYNQNQEVIQTKADTIIDKEVLIYPTISKHLESQESPYSELFREFSINLQKKNSTLLVIGYGFPDDHINQLISQSLNNEDFNLIVFGNINEDKANEFYERHKEKSNFHFIGGFETININGSSKEQHNGHHFSEVITYLGGNING